MSNDLIFGIMMLPINGKYRKKAIAQLIDLKTRYPHLTLVYFNWKSRIECMIYDDITCVTDDGDIEVPCYTSKDFDIIIDTPMPEPLMDDLVKTDEFKVFENLCTIIIAPFYEEISSKMCGFEFAERLAHEHYNKHQLDENGRIIFKFHLGRGI